MENAQTILVIFLSVALACFLVSAIILINICIKVAKHVERITENAEAISDKAESLVEFVEKAATPMAIARLIASGVENVFNRSKSKKK
jgi:uncharacterized protein with PQ loop repeat